MKYKDMVKQVEEMEGTLEQLRRDAVYAIGRLENCLSYEGENRTAIDEVMTRMFAAKECLYTYIEKYKQYNKAMNMEVSIDDDGVA